MLANIDSEINYIFTNDEEYLNRRTRLIPRSEREEEALIRANNPGEPSKQKKKEEEKDKDKEDTKKMGDTKEERDRLKK